MKTLELLVAISLGLTAACAPAVEGPVAVPAYSASDVEVVAGLDTPTFYVDGFYWYWDAGAWFRSPELGGPRVRYERVPPSLARIDHPAEYAHDHVRDHRNGDAHVRLQGARASIGRDHRGR